MDDVRASDDMRDEPDMPDDPYADAVEAVKMLAQLMSQNGIAELDLSFSDVSIRLRSGVVTAAQASAVPPSVPLEAALPETPKEEGFIVTAPMIGTFYTSPAPGEEPFVHIGDLITPGQTVGIIEAMKIMNEITADRGGTLVEFLAENGQAVEYGSPLMRIVPGGAA